MVGIATTTYPPLVAGDEWIFPVAFQASDGSPLDGSGYTLSAELDWQIDKITIDTILDDDDDDRTGILWVDQGEFKFKVKLDESDTEHVPANRSGRLIVFYVDTKGDRYTMFVQPLEVLTP